MSFGNNDNRKQGVEGKNLLLDEVSLPAPLFRFSIHHYLERRRKEHSSH